MAYKFNPFTGKLEEYGPVLTGTGTVSAAADGTAALPGIAFTNDLNTGIYRPGADQLAISTNGQGRLFVDSSGNVGIGVTSVSANLQVAGASDGADVIRAEANSSNGLIILRPDGANGNQVRFGGNGANANVLRFVSGGDAERARIDSSGRLLVGTSTGPSDSTLVLQGNSSNSTYNSVLRMLRNVTNPAADAVLGSIIFGVGNAASSGIECYTDGQWGTNDYPGRLVFSTTADGASSPTERMRITSGGTLSNKTSNIGSEVGQGWSLTSGGEGLFTVPNVCLYVNRISTDGTLIAFFKDNTQEGTISVSGTTVSYNGGHLSRWSQLPSGQERTEILRGSVLSNIDEMCEWGEEDNEQLNRMKVSDVEGDKNVSGVFQAWDDDDDTYTNDFYCAMTGDFIIRIAQGVTVERGDLLMSAGDGTAKPQDDDIIRSKTIAKVTSTNVSCTYEDGSYCVPCVLMAC